jgi:hypothetical protein
MMPRGRPKVVPRFWVKLFLSTQFATYWTVHQLKRRSSLLLPPKIRLENCSGLRIIGEKVAAYPWESVDRANHGANNTAC